jgi:hypothetical protein
MGCESELLKEIHRICVEDLFRALAGIKREHQANKTAHNMRIAITAEGQHRFAIVARNLRLNPNLTRATAHFVVLSMGSIGQWLELATEFDQIAVAIFPFIEKLEIRDDVVEKAHRAVPVRALYGVDPA